MTKEQSGPGGFQMDEATPAAAPELTFSTLVLSLSTSTMVHLGASPGPEAGEAPEMNLPLARQTIDILEMLSEKTKGNLEPQEAALLDSVLHQVHIKYVEARGDSG